MIMPKAMLVTMVLLILSLVAVPHQRETGKELEASKNEIRGIVIEDGSDPPRPLEGITVVAMDADEKPKYQSAPTAANGKFKLIVPIEDKLFKLFVFDSNDRFLSYRPRHTYDNISHPHDLGTIKLVSWRDVASASHGSVPLQAKVEEQIRNTQIISQVDEAAANRIKSRLGSEFTSVIHSCGMISPPLSFPVSYIAQSPNHIYVVLQGDVNRNEQSLDESIKLRILHNEKLAVKRIQHLIDLERIFFSRHKHFGDGVELENDGLVKYDEFFRNGYCFDPIVGSVESNQFNIAHGKEALHYFIFGAPLFPKLTGDTFLFGLPSGEIRYSSKKVNSLLEAQPLPQGFPDSLKRF